MKRIIAGLLALIAFNAYAAGPFIWFGNNSKDLTIDGALTPWLNLPRDANTENTDLIRIKAPTSLTAWNMTLPPDDGTTNQVLRTDGAGVTTWVDGPTVVTGTANTFAGYGSGGLIQTIPDWEWDNTDHGAQVQTTVVPVTGVNGDAHFFNTNFNPAGAVTSTSWNHLTLSTYLSSDNSGFDFDADNSGTLRQLSMGLQATGGGDWGSIYPLMINSNIGNGTDTMVGQDYQAVSAFATFNDNVTVGSYRGYGSYLNAIDGTVVTNASVLYSNNQFDVVNNYTGVFISDNFSDDLTGGLTHFGTSGTITGDIANSYFWGNNNTNITGNVNGYSMARSNANVGSITGGAQIFADFNNITTHTSGNYSSFEAGPGIGTTSGYTGSSIHPTIATASTQVQGYASNPNITTSGLDYVGYGDNANITLLTQNYKGVNIAPTIVGDTTNNGVGVFVDLTNVTNFGTDSVTAIQTSGGYGVGDVEFNGSVSAFVDWPLSDGGGNPTPIHAINSEMTAAASATIANVDKFNFSPIMTLNVGDNATLTSGPIGVGPAALGSINLLQMGTGSTLDYTTGFFNAMVLPSGDGHIDNVVGFRSTAINFGATTTIDNVYLYKSDLVAGCPGTTCWGAYSQDAANNFFEGNTKIGGDVGTDTAAEKLQVEGNVLLRNATGAQPQLKLSEDPDNGTNATTIQAAASIADYTLTLPVDDGAAGEVLSTDGSGVLSWVAAATLPVSLTTGVSGVLPLANGGTNKNATAVNGGLVWSDADSLEITAAGTASQWVLSGGAGTPTMSNTTTTGKVIDGTADEIQLRLQANATQTNSMFVIEQDGGTDSFTVSNMGKVFAGAAVSIDGSADEQQLEVQGVAGQTANLLNVENSSGTDFFNISSAGSVTAGRVVIGGLTTAGEIRYTSNSQTIASGVITGAYSYIIVDTEGAAASDSLDTVNGCDQGDIIILRAASSARTVIITDNTGNIQTAGSLNFSLDNAGDTWQGICFDGSDWMEISRSDNGA